MTAWPLAVAAATTMAIATAAHAQVAVATRPAFSVERATPAPGNALFVGVEEAEVPAAGRWAWSITTWIASRPIVLRSLDTGEVASEPVRLRWGHELAAARGLGVRYLVGVAVPSALQWGDRLAGIGLDERALARFVLGDLRLHGRARIVGAPGAPGLAVAIAASLTVPTGADDHFAGEAGAVIGWGLRAGYRTADLSLAGGVGLRLRTTEVVLLSPARPHGNELTASVGAAARVGPLGRQLGGSDRAWVFGEAEAAVGDDAGKGARGPSPAELRLGVRAQLGHCWSLALAGGGGVRPDEVGAPGYRFMAQFTWHQDPVLDRDGDGVRDGADACWRQREDRDGHDDWDGCPDPDDDGDGVDDADDRCPLAAEDRDGYRDSDGCPEAEQIMTDRED